jgi:iron complex outermembrane recepter protein
MYTTRHLNFALFLAAAYPVVASAADAEKAVSGSTQEVIVTGEKQPYRALSATGATKSDADIKDLPQSVRVLTADLLKDVGVTDLAGALDMTSGTARQSNLGGLWDSYSMRGFTGDPNFGSDFLVNGFSSSRGYNGLRDSASTTSVEVLKGPASALYGRGEPGGTVNITTKKPLFQPAQAIEASIGSFNTYRTAVDLTGPISEKFAFRLNAAYQKGDSFRDTIKTERSFVSPSFLWMMDNDTTLSYEVEAVKQKVPFDRGVVAVNGVLGLVPNSRFLGEPGDGPVTVDSLGHQVFFQHFFNDDWSVQSGFSYRDSSLAGTSTEAVNLLSDGRTLRRMRRLRDFSANDTSGRLELLGKFKTGAIAHSVLVGVDAYRFNDRRIQFRASPTATAPYAIDIYNPIYGQTPPAMSLIVNTKEEQRSHAVYAQDQVDLTAQWKALFGVRFDRYDQSLSNYRRGVSSAQSLSATSPRVGLVYEPSKSTSLYATAAKGFRPNSGISVDNTGFPAETSKAYEIGAKLDSADGKFSSTIALFSISKNNVLTINPANIDFSIPAGEVASKGLEIDASGEVMRNVRLSAAYAYTDSKVTKGDTAFPTGSAFPNVPKHSGNILLVRNFALGTGFASIGAGVNYVGERYGDVAFASSFKLPSYATVRLISSYSPSKQLRLAFNVDNLFNKAYYASSYSQVWVAPGTERTATLTANYKF